MKTFKKKVLDNLVTYCKQSFKNVILNGVYPRNGKRYEHILDIEGQVKLDIIKEFNLIKNAKNVKFLIEDKLHCDAHHLNSSQIMCYNFFRPLITDDETTTEKLITIMQNYCPLLQYTKDSECKFEFVDGDGTNFDFYIRSGEINVYCEIKYTECNFSKSSSCTDPRKRYNDVYKKIIENTQDLWTSKVSEKTVMHQYYQLFRNAAKAKKGKSYVLFICPKDREDLEKVFDEFRSELLISGNDMIKYVYWENLIDIAVKNGMDLNEFITKYFGYK